MDLADLKALLAVADARSFTRAAALLHVAQPPLSRRIAALEARLGVPLIRRERPLTLTEAGRFLVEQARQLFVRVEEIEAATRRIGAERRRYFGIGFVGSALYGTMPGAIRRLRDSFPDVEVGLHELTTAQQRLALENRQIDVGVGRLDLGEAPGIARVTLSEEALVLAVVPKHRLAGAATTSLAEVAAEPVIPYPSRPRPSFADFMIALLRATGVDPQVAIEANDVQAALGLVAAGIGATLVPTSVAESGRTDVAFVALDDEAARSPVILSYRAADRSPLVQSFLDLARR